MTELRRQPVQIFSWNNNARQLLGRDELSQFLGPLDAAAIVPELFPWGNFGIVLLEQVAPGGGMTGDHDVARGAPALDSEPCSAPAAPGVEHDRIVEQLP